MKKQLLLLAMILLPMVASAHDIAVANADGKTIYYVWTNDKTKLEVSGYYGSGNVVIPESVEYDGSTYSVTSIGGSAFSCSGLTSVTIPNSVTSIGNDAFYGCSNLTTIVSEIETPFEISIIISNTAVTLIIPKGTKAAYQSTNGWSSFTNIVEPGEGGIIGGIFWAGGIKYVIGEGNTVSLATGDKNLSGNLDIPTQVTFNGITYTVMSIDGTAFQDCTGLTTVTIGNSVTSIGDLAFQKCSNLESVTIGTGVLTIGISAFYGCSSLTSLLIPNGVTSIGDSAFWKCSNLESVTIGTGVLTIGSDIFYGHKPAKVIWLTNTPPSGYSDATGTVNYVANNQYSLSNMTVYSFLSSIFEVGGVRYVPISPSERTCDAIDCLYNESAENVNIGETISYKGVKMAVKNVKPYTCYRNSYIKNVQLNLNGPVGDYAFYRCPSLEQVTASNVTTIGCQAFYNCPSLEQVTVNNVTTIENQAFCTCSSLKQVTASNVTNINSEAFRTCTALKTALLYIKGSVGDLAFNGCNALATVTLGEEVKEIKFAAFGGCSALHSINIPNSVTSLGQSAFYGCSTMTSATIGSGVSTISIDAFENCSKLTTVRMGIGVKSIHGYAFSGCSSLNDVQIGSSVETIEMYAFQNCSSLPKIQIPQSLISIGNYTFDGCTKLKQVFIDDNEGDNNTTLSLGSNGSNPLFASCPLDSVYIGRDISYDTTQSHGYSPFYRNTSLRAVKITDKETGISANEFYGCTNLQRVVIGDGVTTIGNRAFSGCSSLRFFAFGSQVQTIGQEAFSDCTSVIEISSKAQTPPACGSQALDDINKWECQLFVPDGCLAVYQAADQWKEFFFAEEGEGTVDPDGPDGNPDDPNVQKCAKPTIALKNGKLHFECETDGVEYHYTVSAPQTAGDSGNDVDVSTTYIIRVFASKKGYMESDVATAEIDFRNSGGDGGLKGDVDGDGEVDIADAVRIVNFIVGKIPALAPRSEMNMTEPE